MKPIKFDLKNAGKINTFLHDVNGLATSHAYESFTEIERDFSVLKTKVEKLLGAKYHAVGVKLILESGGEVSSAYKYTRTGIRVEMECRASGWFITSICRADIYQKGGMRQIQFTTDHHDIAVSELRKQYFVS